MTLLGTHAADFQALLINYCKKVNVMKKTRNTEVLASIMRATEKDLDSLKTSKGLIQRWRRSLGLFTWKQT
jgi:recombinational DNA repair protein RecT